MIHWGRINGSRWSASLFRLHRPLGLRWPEASLSPPSDSWYCFLLLLLPCLNISFSGSVTKSVFDVGLWDNHVVLQSSLLGGYWRCSRQASVETGWDLWQCQRLARRWSPHLQHWPLVEPHRIYARVSNDLIFQYEKCLIYTYIDFPCETQVGLDSIRQFLLPRHGPFRRNGESTSYLGLLGRNPCR